MRSPSNLCNLDEVLTSDDARSLAKQLSAVSSDTKCICKDSKPCKGLQIGIAVFKQLYIGSQTKSAAYKEVADQLNVQFWKLSSCGNSIVVILGTADGKIHISTSPSVKKRISDNAISKTVQVALPYLKDKDYAKGLEVVVGKLQYYDAHPSSAGIFEGIFSSAFVFVLLIGGGVGFIVGAVFLLNYLGFCKNCGSSSSSSHHHTTNFFGFGDSDGGGGGGGGGSCGGGGGDF